MHLGIKRAELLNLPLISIFPEKFFLKFWLKFSGSKVFVNESGFSLKLGAWMVGVIFYTRGGRHGFFFLALATHACLPPSRVGLHPARPISNSPLVPKPNISRLRTAKKRREPWRSSIFGSRSRAPRSAENRSSAPCPMKERSPNHPSVLLDILLKQFPSKMPVTP